MSSPSASININVTSSTPSGAPSALMGGTATPLAGGGNMPMSGMPNLSQLSSAGTSQISGMVTAMIGPVLGPIMPVIAGLAIGAGIFAGAVYAFKSGVEYFVARGEQLAQYSAPISQARAQAQVRGIEQDIREAEALGEGISKLTDAQSRIETMFSDVMLPIKEFLVEVMADLLTKIANIVEEYGPEVKAQLYLATSWLEAIWNAIKLQPEEAAAALQRGQERARQARQQPRLGATDFMGRLMGGVPGAGAFAALPDQAALPGAPGAPADPQRATLTQQNNTPAFSGGDMLNPIGFLGNRAGQAIRRLVGGGT